MALKFADRVLETSTTAGTGTLSLGGAVSGYQTFIAGIGTGNTTYYAIYDAIAQVWEVGLGTVTSGTPNTLARTTVLANSSGTTSPLTLAGNSVQVSCVYPAEKVVVQDASGIVSAVPVQNLSSGVAGSMPYQTAANTTTMLPIGSLNQVMTSSGSIPQWTNQATMSVGSAKNITLGANNQIPYQISSGTTGFIAAPTTSSTFLQWNGSAFTWAAAGGGSSVVTKVGTSPASGTVTFSGLTGTSQTYLLVWQMTGSFGGSPYITFNGTSSGYNMGFVYNTMLGVSGGNVTSMSNITTGFASNSNFGGFAVIQDSPFGNPSYAIQAANTGSNPESYTTSGNNSSILGSLSSISLVCPTGASGNVTLYQFT